jgi:hypothetical protein
VTTPDPTEGAAAAAVAATPEQAAPPAPATLSAAESGLIDYLLAP